MSHPMHFSTENLNRHYHQILMYQRYTVPRSVFTEPQMQDICLKHESEQSNDQGYNLGILKNNSSIATNIQR